MGTPFRMPRSIVVSWGALNDQGALFTTSPTYIPYGSSSPDLRPPSTHPRASSLIFVDRSGQEVWSWQDDLNIQGMLYSEDRQEVVLGSGDRISDYRRDVYGVYIFDAKQNDKQGLNRLVSRCLTPQPVFFNFDQTSDGRIAVAEHPYLDEDGILKGEYRLRVFRWLCYFGKLHTTAKSSFEVKPMSPGRAVDIQSVSIVKDKCYVRQSYIEPVDYTKSDRLARFWLVSSTSKTRFSHHRTFCAGSVFPE